MRRCDISRNHPIKNEYVELGQYIEVNRKILKVYAVFSKNSDYFYLAKLYESSNHYFYVSELEKGVRKKYKVLTSFTGSEEGLEKTIEIVYRLPDTDKNNKGLRRIK